MEIGGNREVYIYAYCAPRQNLKGGLIRINLIFASLDEFRFDYLATCLSLLG